MKPSPSPTPPDPALEAAATWAIRHDRGLTAPEQDEFSQWLAAAAAHRAAWAETRWGWDELDRLAGLQTSVHASADPDLLAPKKRRLAPVYRFALLLVAAAAVVMLGFIIFAPRPTVTAPPGTPRQLALIEQRTLPDGSTVELNRGAVIAEEFSEGIRRVRLLRGEAHFQVMRDPARPFIVEAAGVAVRAVGTAFNVRLEATAVEVLVTEGRVQVDDAVRGESLLAPSATEEPPVLVAGQSARVDLAPTMVPQVAAVSAVQIEDQLAWKPRLLDFTNAAMPEIVAAFNRGNPVHLSLGDALLADMRLSATFRSDNVEGFVRLMESDFGLRAEWRGEYEIVLRRAK
jgi:transmembrane sensor